MIAEQKLVKQRLSVLQLAEALGNVSEACRQRAVSRTQFYEYKRRFQTHGIEGLKDLPPIAKSHPMTTPPETVEKIKSLAHTHPAYGCNRLEALLPMVFPSVMSPSRRSWRSISWALATTAGWRWKTTVPTPKWNSPVNRSPSSRKTIPALRNAMWKAASPANY